MEDQFKILYDQSDLKIPYQLIKDNMLTVMGPVKMAQANVELSLVDPKQSIEELKAEGLTPTTMEAVSLFYKLVADHVWISAGVAIRLLSSC